MAPRPGDGQPDGAGRWRDGRDGRIPARLRGRGRPAPGGAGGAVRPQRHVHGLPEARDGRGGLPPLRRRAWRALPRRPGAAGRQDRRPVARRHAARRVSPDRPDAAVAADPARINDFSFRDDAEGLRCPIGAHIRRANPRDAAGFFDGRLSNRHRIIRRGRTYGPPLSDGVLEDDGVERGLVFVCFNAEHLAPVRDDPGALDRRRRPVRAGRRQGLPDRRAARRLGAR